VSTITEARHIMVVEDEPALSQMIHDVLELYGLSSVGAGTPAIAHSLAASASPGLFLIDLMLPGLSGIELAQQLRANGFESTPMIAMSASNLILQVAEESGVFQETLRKPFELSDLMAALERHLD